MEEFNWCVGKNEVEAAISRLQNSDWRWSDQTYVPNEIPFQAISDYLAQKFLQNPTVTFGADNQYQLTFYRVTRFEDGAELMSWTPTPIPVGKGQTFVSFVIRFRLQTVSWREDRLIYHALSVRRWVTRPLIKPTGKGFPYGGVTAYIGDTRRWLDGATQPFSFVTLNMERWDGEVQWCPQASAELLRDAGEIPLPLTLAQNPAYTWSQFNPNSRTVQAAVVFSSRLRKHPCLPGVSPLDLARLDWAIADRLPVMRVGEGVKIKSLSKQKSFWFSGKTTPILHPDIASSAASAVLKLQPTVMILWETEACRDALIAELCRILSLSATSQENIYAGAYGSLRILTQDVGDLGELLDVGDFTVRANLRKRRRIEQLEERIQLIASFLEAIKTFVKKTEDQNRLWFVRLRVADEIEVPTCIAKNSEGSRANGVFKWQGVYDEPRRSLYLSISKLPNSAQHLLRKAESRLDSAKRPAGNAIPLEIAVVHHTGIESEQLAHFIHSLRNRWPFFADAVSLPLPFPFATKAKEYAVSARDPVEAIESNESED